MFSPPCNSRESITLESFCWQYGHFMTQTGDGQTDRRTGGGRTVPPCREYSLPTAGQAGPRLYQPAPACPPIRLSVCPSPSPVAQAADEGRELVLVVARAQRRALAFARALAGGGGGGALALRRRRARRPAPGRQARGEL